MNNLSTTVKMLRKQYNLTQEELSLKSGVGLRFVRDLEQGKETLRLDKVNQLLDFFNYEMIATQKNSHPWDKPIYFTKINWLGSWQKAMQDMNSLFELSMIRMLPEVG